VNRYGAMARSHWARWLPQQYATISGPDSFFSTLGQEAARQIDELMTELAGDGQPGEDYLARAARLHGPPGAGTATVVAGNGRSQPYAGTGFPVGWSRWSR
jgi:hypothetical protein